MSTLNQEVIDKCVQRLPITLNLYKILENPSTGKYLRSVRSEVLIWMIEISSYSEQASVARDVAIQIFTTYLNSTLTKNPDPSLSICFSYKVIALACFAIAFKMTTSKTSHLENFLSMIFTKFKFKDDDLHCYEVIILKEVDFDISPSVNYSIFLQSFIASMNISSITSLNALTVEYDLIMNMCLKDHVFLQFSTSTIAVGAVIYACSLLDLDFSPWMKRIPSNNGITSYELFTATCATTQHSLAICTEQEFSRSLDVTICLDMIVRKFTASKSSPGPEQEPTRTNRYRSSPKDIQQAPKLFDANLNYHSGLSKKRHFSGTDLTSEKDMALQKKKDNELAEMIDILQIELLSSPLKLVK